MRLNTASVRLAPSPGEKILDVATGTGRTARRIAARGATVTGIDMSAELVHRDDRRAPLIERGAVVIESVSAISGRGVRVHVVVDPLSDWSLRWSRV
jgi:protein-L-isoaspartate O-methyltransferase